MIQRDFMLRMIEQVGVLLRHLLGRNLSVESVEMELDSLTSQWIGLPSGMLLALPADEVIRLFEESNRMVGEKCFLMGEVCRARALVTVEEGSRGELHAKALEFYGECARFGLDDDLKAQIEERMAELRQSG